MLMATPARASTSTLVTIEACSSRRPAPVATAAPGRTALSSKNFSLGTTCAGRAPPSTFCAGSSRPVWSPLRTTKRKSAVARTGLAATAVNPISVKTGRTMIAFFTPSRLSTHGAMKRLTTSCTT